MSRHWKLFARDVEDACRKICRYTQGPDQAGFLREGLVYDATLRNLEIIGEAAKAIPDEARQRFPHINWKGVVWLRDVLAHAYFALDDDTLWDLVTNKVPELLAVLQLHVLTHLIQFFYGATWNLSRKGLFNWRDEQAGDFETLVKTSVAPRRVLRILRDFILFTRKDGELSKVVLRPQGAYDGLRHRHANQDRDAESD